MSDDTAGLNDLQHAIWSAGDYDAVAELFWDVGAVVAQAAAIEPGLKVLDVATGTGNAAIRAAEAGSEVVGLDITPELFDDARRREALAGVQVQWIEGDAEALPFEDESFDRVLSTFGVMFAGRHDVAAAELVRCCRPGGTIVLASWTADSFVGRIFETVAGHVPEARDAQSPALWGREGYVRTILGGQLLLAFERRSVDLVLEAPVGEQQSFADAFGPMILAKRMLDAERYDALADELQTLAEAADVGDGEVRIPSEYLLVVGARP